MPSPRLSDKAIAIFAFAAYHQLSAGEPVVDVVLEDGSGHAADPEAVEELERLELARSDGRRAAFTDSGKAVLAKAIEALRTAA